MTPKTTLIWFWLWARHPIRAYRVWRMWRDWRRSLSTIVSQLPKEPPSGDKLLAWAALYGIPGRKVIQDGRQPDPWIGVPLETDAELRDRIQRTIMGQKLEQHLRQI